MILDLWPSPEPFEFLRRLRETVPGGRTTVIVWTGEELATEDRERLEAAVLAVVVKGCGGTEALLEELQSLLPALDGQPGSRGVGGIVSAFPLGSPDLESER